MAVSDNNIRIADQVFGELGVGDEFYEHPGITFGTFDNCREYGMTVSINGWTFCAYEHRNSDQICIEGCPTGKVQSYGPYAGEDKYDVLFTAEWQQYHLVRLALNAAMHAVEMDYNITRSYLKTVMKKAATGR